MNALKDRFWAKVLFSQFIKHYRKMTPEQKVADIDASMDALEDLDDTGDSFGAKMVRWSMERIEQYPMARENGKKGGRPRKDSAAADAPECDDGECRGTVATASANKSQQGKERTGVKDSLRCGDKAPVRKSSPMPADRQEVIDFASLEGLDVDDAAECWYVTVQERDGMTADGKNITNWKAYVRKWCETRKDNRRSA